MNSREPSNDFDKELRIHLELEAEEQSGAGTSEREAKDRARRAFGNATIVAEDVRAIWHPRWLEDAWQDLLHGLRMLRKSRSFTAVAILTLGVAIGANTAIFSVVNAVLLRPLPYPDAGRLAIIWSGLGDANRAPASRFELFESRERTREFDQIAGIWVTNGALPGEGEPEQVKVGVVTNNFLPLLCARPALGRFFAPEDDASHAPFGIMISHGVWVRRFGSDPKVVGHSVRFGQGSAVVLGVLPESFRLILPGHTNIPATVDVFYTVPIDAAEPGGPAFLHLIGRLHSGSNFTRAQAEADSIATQITSWDGNLAVSNFHLFVFPLQADDVRDVRATLLLLFGGVGFVLVIGCANVANLLLARATKRTRETTVRASLGASRGRLVRQFLTENLLLGLLGGFAGLGIGWSAMRAILAARPPSLLVFGPVNIDARVLLFTLGLTVLTSVVFGFAPILSAGRVDLTQNLKEMGRPAGRRMRRWTGVLVSCEVALGFALLCGTSLLMRTFVNILRVDPGFRPQNVLTFKIPPPSYGMLQQLQQNLAALPGVQSASAVSHLPLDDAANWYDYYWKEGTPTELQSTVMADHRSILPGYFRTIGATLVQGRDFVESDDATHEHVAIVDDVLAQQLWPGIGAIGQKLNISDSPKGPYQFQRDWVVVIGVVRHIQCHSLTAMVRPQIYVPFQLAPRPMAIVVHTSGPVEGLAESARKQVALLNKTIPVSHVAPLSENVSRARAESRFASLLAMSLSSVALILACIGIYGVLSYSVAQRTSEIGLRMAIGARRLDVMRLIAADSSASVLLGLAGGFLLSVGLTPFLKSLLFGVTPG